MHFMRIALALVGLMCGAVSALGFPADNIPYCSSGFQKPARIVLSDTQSMFVTEGNNPKINFDAPQKVTLSVGSRTEVFSFHEPGESAVILYYDRYHDRKSAAGSEIGEGEVIWLRSRSAKRRLSYLRIAFSGLANEWPYGQSSPPFSRLS